MGHRAPFLAASIVHFGTYSIAEAKAHMGPPRRHPPWGLYMA